MKLLVNQIFENKEAAALPGLLESGGLPALVSGLSAVHRANLAAGLRLKTGAPLFVLCPDDTTAENFANDLRSMLGEEVTCLGMRDFTFYSTEAASRQAARRAVHARRGTERSHSRVDTGAASAHDPARDAAPRGI